MSTQVVAARSRPVPVLVRTSAQKLVEAAEDEDIAAIGQVGMERVRQSFGREDRN